MKHKIFPLKSINVGRIETLHYGEKTLKTAMRKRPITEPAYVSKTGFLEDQQEFKGHGGTEKALCLYPTEHYTYWQDILEGVENHTALFGENLSSTGITEDNTHIGDIFQLGEAVIQVTEPRTPCHKIATRYNVPDLARQMRDQGNTGFLFRVLEEGYVRPGDALYLKERDANQVSVSFVNHVKFFDPKNQEKIAEVLAVDALSKTLRKSLEKRIANKFL
ncbi:MOSC domain-containing protein [Virgibacillus sp. MSP4-1]|uniref:MOSC domain-containing protein n=1 Tax=Virgibacillus sp. MSP4-1 TaxID=2700081 RepID=UPI0003A80705|nr:MOSC domain-containing protein [Virgibacillus sp. MSP4-1]QHS24099.1 MOSC domain-containing protein [Virgibacillus sp. MSP4-1]